MTNHFIEINGQSLPIKMRRNANARRITLRLSRDGAMVQLTLPKRCAEKKAIAFANTQSQWIAKQLQSKPTAQPFVPNMKLEIFGDEFIFKHHASRITVAEGENIYIGGDEEFFARRVEDYIKKEAREKFSEMARELADEIGETISGVSLRDTSSRWGSCSSKKRINLSWRLALAPLSVAHYVIAHEVAHLMHFNHSTEFWELVEQLHPNWQKERDWLRKNGAILHAYGAA
jgi:Predicted metal-dependent hydrolase